MPSGPMRASLITLALLAGTPAALASTTESWDTFRRDVETACVEATSAQISQPQVVVDPFGSESYGLAVVSGLSSENEPRSVVCVYDKAARTVEVGGTMALESAVPVLRPDPTQTGSTAPAASAQPTSQEPVSIEERLTTPAEMTAPAGEVAALERPQEAGPDGGQALFGGLCDAACSTALDGLADGDRENLVELPNQIGRAIAANEASSLGEGPAQARQAAGAAAAFLRGGGESDGLASVSADLAGPASCTLYYFGYEGEAARTVGTHQCSVSEGEDGALSVEKTSGERLSAELRPLTGPVSAVVGRTFEAGQSEQSYDPESPDNAGGDQFGNTVGYAVASGGDVLVISSQRRRFDQSDSFFWVLAVDPN